MTNNNDPGDISSDSFDGFSLARARDYFRLAGNLFKADLRNADGAVLSFDKDTIGRYFVHRNSASFVMFNEQTKEITVLSDPTYDPLDWPENVTPIWDKVALGGSYLTGFNWAIDKENESGASLYDRVLSEIDRLIIDEGAETINFSGYSRGGGMGIAFVARAVAQDNLHERIRFGDLYTFGAPHIGDAEFAARFNEMSKRIGLNVWRVENDADPVPLATEWIRNVPVGHLARVTMAAVDSDKTRIQIDPQRAYVSGDLSRRFAQAIWNATGFGNEDEAALGHLDYGDALEHVGEVRRDPVLAFERTADPSASQGPSAPPVIPDIGTQPRFAGWGSGCGTPSLSPFTAPAGYGV